MSDVIVVIHDDDVFCYGPYDDQEELEAAMERFEELHGEGSVDYTPLFSPTDFEDSIKYEKERLHHD